MNSLSRRGFIVGPIARRGLLIQADDDAGNTSSLKDLAGN